MIVPTRKIELSEEGILNLHVPKTGGQSINLILDVQNHGHQPASSPHVQALMGEASLVFSMVRHPCDRALSVYHWLRQMHENENRLVRAENIVFSNWASSVDVNEFWMKVDINWLNQVSPLFRSQFYFLKMPKRKTLCKRIDYIGRFEKFGESWDHIRILARQKTGVKLPFKLPKYNGSKASRLNWKDEINAQTEKRLREIYAIDFSTFEYE